jgi:hypothetical protein
MTVLARPPAHPTGRVKPNALIVASLLLLASCSPPRYAAICQVSGPGQMVCIAQPMEAGK